jgi:hypothetical protein
MTGGDKAIEEAPEGRGAEEHREEEEEETTTTGASSSAATGGGKRRGGKKREAKQIDAGKKKIFQVKRQSEMPKIEYLSDFSDASGNMMTVFVSDKDAGLIGTAAV